MPGKYLKDFEKQKVANVFKYFQEKGDSKGICYERTAEATGVSRSTVYRIEKDLKQGGAVASSKRRKRGPYKSLDNFDLDVVRNKVREFYVIRHQLPSIKALHASLKQDINYPGGRTHLWKVLKTLGFSWKKTTNNRKELVEKPEIFKQRLKFYDRKAELESQGFTLVYTDETWIDSCYTKKSCWQGPGVDGVRGKLNKGQRLIVVHAGSSSGFVPGAKLVYKAASSTGDYHGEMDGQRFTKWLQEMLLPNLTGKCAIVLDNASYHSMHAEKCPTTSTKKDDIKEWLRKHGVQFNKDLTRTQLLDLARMHKPAPSYTVDTIIRNHGHEVLRLPPYHPDFNPIELIWSQLKEIVRQRNVTFRFDDLRRITDEAFALIGSERWSRAVDHVHKLINDMKRSDHYSGARPTDVVINITGSDPEDTDSADECGSSTDTASECGGDDSELSIDLK